MRCVLEQRHWKEKATVHTVTPWWRWTSAATVGVLDTFDQTVWQRMDKTLHCCNPSLENLSADASPYLLCVLIAGKWCSWSCVTFEKWKHFTHLLASCHLISRYTVTHYSPMPSNQQLNITVHKTWTIFTEASAYAYFPHGYFRVETSIYSHLHYINTVEGGLYKYCIAWKEMYETDAIDSARFLRTIFETFSTFNLLFHSQYFQASFKGTPESKGAISGCITSVSKSL